MPSLAMPRQRGRPRKVVIEENDGNNNNVGNGSSKMGKQNLQNLLLNLFGDDESNNDASQSTTLGDNNATNNNTTDGGPQTRGRAEKLKSRWMNMVMQGSNGCSDATSQESDGFSPLGSPVKMEVAPMALPPPPQSRPAPTLVFPAGLERADFEPIPESIFLSEKSRRNNYNKAESNLECECTFSPHDLAMTGQLGCRSSDCLNRVLYVECGNRCSAGEYCANKQFQRREYSDVRLFDAGPKGLGVVAVNNIAAGDFIVEYVGEVLDFEAFRKRLKSYSKAGCERWFFMALSADQYVDASKKGNVSRFINHSCDANAETQKWTVRGQIRIGFFATRDIAAGEEITIDYQYETYGERQQRCFCGSSKCRGYIGKLVSPVEKTVTSPFGSPSSSTGEPTIPVRRKTAEIGDIIDRFVSNGGVRTESDVIQVARLVARPQGPHCSALIDLLFNSSPAFLAGGTSENPPPLAALFIKLHGVDILSNWLIMDDLVLVADILELLAVLPMPNRNVLDSANIWARVEKMAQTPIVEPNPDDDEAAVQKRKQQMAITTLAKSLIEQWSKLQTVFKIPRVTMQRHSSHHVHLPPSQPKNAVAQTVGKPTVDTTGRSFVFSKNQTDRSKQSGGLSDEEKQLRRQKFAEEQRRLAEQELARLAELEAEKAKQNDVTPVKQFSAVQQQQPQLSARDIADDEMLRRFYNIGIDAPRLHDELEYMAKYDAAGLEVLFSESETHVSTVEKLSSKYQELRKFLIEHWGLDDIFPSTDDGTEYYYEDGTVQSQWEQASKKKSVSFKSPTRPLVVAVKASEEEEEPSNKMARIMRSPPAVAVSKSEIRKRKAERLKEKLAKRIKLKEKKSRKKHQKSSDSFRRDVASFIAKVLKHYHIDRSGRKLQSDVVKSLSKKLTDNVVEKELQKYNTTDTSKLQWTSAQQSKVQSYVEAYAAKVAVSNGKSNKKNNNHRKVESSSAAGPSYQAPAR